MKKAKLDLPQEYYLNTNTLFLAKDILGKKLCTHINGNYTAGIIVETEAYCGTNDMACHGRHGHRTPRNKTLFAQGGVFYVYICYGIHHLLNIVTHNENEPHAILIRALMPIEGIEIMLDRRKKSKVDYTITKGPGALTQALGITSYYDAIPCNSDTIWLENTAITYKDEDIFNGPRVGVSNCGNDAILPYRYYIKHNKWVSAWKP